MMKISLCWKWLSVAYGARNNRVPREGQQCYLLLRDSGKTSILSHWVSSQVKYILQGLGKGIVRLWAL